MQDKRLALVTGANQGIGLQIAKDLVAHGFTVPVGSRNLEEFNRHSGKGPAQSGVVLPDSPGRITLAAAAEKYCALVLSSTHLLSK